MSGAAERRGGAAENVCVGGRAQPSTGNERDREAQRAQRQTQRTPHVPGVSSAH